VAEILTSSTSTAKKERKRKKEERERERGRERERETFLGGMVSPFSTSLSVSSLPVLLISQLCT
jgi:hypothetical protein